MRQVKGTNKIMTFIKERLYKIIMGSFIVLLITVLCVQNTSAGTQIPENLNMSVDGADASQVRAINASYDNNLYISLRDTARLFSGSAKQFNLDINGGAIVIVTGEGYTDELDHSGWSSEELSQHPGGDPGNNSLTIDGEDRKYFSLLLNMGDYYDAFMSPMDLAMILDVDMDMDDSGKIVVDTSKKFNINPARMESYGFFDALNTVVAGDATTGEVFYGYDMEKVYPIASTTKLMTYLLTMDAISSGTITADDKVTISDKAAKLSGSQDGAIALESGWQIPVSELILGALLPSSNECALSLAEYVGGTEEAFVVRMNEKAEELGLKSAMFYNSNGLPIFTDTVIAAKTQNRMSGYDMFKLCSHIVRTYPQVKEVTSLKTARMETLKRDLKNTNGLLYNMPEVNGLKTGTTDRSGACLITSLTVQGADGPHDLIVVVLGAENSQTRIRVSELMARYAINVVGGNAARISYSINDDTDAENERITSESIVKSVVEYALKKN